MKASIAQPWKKYHREEPLHNYSVEQKFCSLIENANNNNLSEYAVNYMEISGNSYSYIEIFDMSARLASAYKKSGVKKEMMQCQIVI